MKIRDFQTKTELACTTIVLIFWNKSRLQQFQVSNLDRKTRYEFWVTAHTEIGEGSSSRQVTSSPTERIPAKIASFDDKFSAVAKQEIRLPCMAGELNFATQLSCTHAN